MAGLCVGQETSSDGCLASSPSIPDQDYSTEPFKESDVQTEEDKGAGGWRYEFIDVVDKELECGTCLLPLKNPFMTRCGHNICKTCLDKLFEKNAFCPEDRTPLTKADVFPDMKCHRKIMSLRVKCPYAEMEPYDCRWTGELNDLMKEKSYLLQHEVDMSQALKCNKLKQQKHLEGCESEEIVCTRDNCSERLTRSKFKQHVDTECQWRNVACYYCQVEVVLCMHQAHQDTDCPEFTIGCPNSCTEHVTRRLVDHHLLSDCLNRMIKCPFADVGCEDEVAARELEKHLNESIGTHLNAFYSNQGKISRTSLLEKQEQGQKIEMLRRELDDVHLVTDKKIAELTLQNQAKANELGQSKREIENLKRDIKQLIVAKEEQDKNSRIIRASLLEKQEQKKKIETLKRELDAVRLDMNKNTAELRLQKQALANELGQSKQVIKDLKRDNKRLTVANEEQDKYLKQQEKSMKHLEENLKLLAYAPLAFRYPDELSALPALLSFVLENENKQVLDNLVDFLKEESVSNCQVMKNSWSYIDDDQVVFIWFIKDFEMHQKEQKEDEDTDTTSPFFFTTSEKGYYLQVRLDPYGYDQSRETHFSCCLGSEEGPHDNEIVFPHEQVFRVTFINFKDRRNDVVAEITFEMIKPTAFDCLESIIHKILSLDQTDEFLLNDTLILKTSVKHYSA